MKLSLSPTILSADIFHYSTSVQSIVVVPLPLSGHSTALARHAHSSCSQSQKRFDPREPPEVTRYVSHYLKADCTDHFTYFGGSSTLSDSVGIC